MSQTSLAAADKASGRQIIVSTDMFAERDRFDEWRETYALKVARVDVEVPDRRAFRAGLRMQALEQVVLIASAFTPRRILRTKELVRDGNDDLYLSMVTSGALTLRFGGGEARLVAGEAALTPTHVVGHMESDRDGTMLTLRIPGGCVPDMLGRLVHESPRTIPATHQALRLLLLYGRGLMDDSAALGPALATLADCQMRELIAHLFDPAGELARAAPSGGVKAARLRAVIAGIEQHLTNPQLSAAWLGARLGVSDRYVQHLLVESDLSFSELVRRKRIELARRLLEQPTVKPRRIVDVAYEVGFGDLSNFNRAFRARFGCTPSDVQHRR